jgi:tartrate-resistant acid phosphatase type 5
LEAHALQLGHGTEQVPDLAVELDHEKPAHAGAHGTACCGGGIEEAERDVSAFIHECREAIEGQAAALHLDPFGQIAEVPAGDARAVVGGFGERLKGAAGLVAEAAAEVGKVSSHGDGSAGVIDDPEVHVQVIGQRLEIERRWRDPLAGEAAKLMGKRIQQARISAIIAAPSWGTVSGGLQASDGGIGGVRGRDELRAELLGQRLDQSNDLFLEHPRHQPLERFIGDMVDRGEGKGGGDAVGGFAGVEPILQGKPQAADGDLVGVCVRGDILHLSAEQVLPLHEQQAGVVLLGFTSPLLKDRPVVDPLGYAAVIEAVLHLRISQEVARAQAVFKPADPGDEALVVLEERRGGVIFAVDQGMANEDLARGDGIDCAIVDRPAVDEHQTVKCYSFEGHHVCGPPLPVGFGVRALHQVAGISLNPLRLDGGGGAGVELRGVDEFGGHDPAGASSEEGGSRKDAEGGAARPGVFVEILLIADVAEQAGEQGAVDRIGFPLVNIGRLVRHRDMIGDCLRRERYACLTDGTPLPAAEISQQRNVVDGTRGMWILRRRMQWAKGLIVLVVLLSGCAAPRGPGAELFPAGAEVGADAPQVNLLAFADWGVRNPIQQRVAQSMARYVEQWPGRFDGALLAGDNFYVRLRGVEDRAWRPMFEGMYDPRRLDMPFFAVLGNHDYEPGKDVVQLDYARLNPESRWTMPARWYRVDLPADEPLVTVLMLDSNRRELKEAQWQEQLEWMEDELRGERGVWTVVVAHHPMFSNGRHIDAPMLQEQWGPLLDRYGVDVYVSGHDHNLQHLEIEGWHSSFVVSGGGGAKLYRIRRDDRGPFARAVHGFAHLQFSPEAMVLRLVDLFGRPVHVARRERDGEVRVLEASRR